MAAYCDQGRGRRNAPVGDLFETLDIAFGTPLSPNELLDFMVDTDNAALNSPIVPAVPVVATPEPASFGLLATGLLAIGMVRRRKRSA